MLEMAETIAKLRREIATLRDRTARAPSEGGDESPTDERPPHY